jgi:hypothetical protein
VRIERGSDRRGRRRSELVVDVPETQTRLPHVRVPEKNDLERHQGTRDGGEYGGGARGDGAGRVHRCGSAGGVHRCGGVRRCGRAHIARSATDRTGALATIGATVVRMGSTRKIGIRSRGGVWNGYGLLFCVIIILIFGSVRRTRYSRFAGFHHSGNGPKQTGTIGGQQGSRAGIQRTVIITFVFLLQHHSWG